MSSVGSLQYSREATEPQIHLKKLKSSGQAPQLVRALFPLAKVAGSIPYQSTNKQPKDAYKSMSVSLPPSPLPLTLSNQLKQEEAQEINNNNNKKKPCWSCLKNLGAIARTI